MIPALAGSKKIAMAEVPLSRAYPSKSHEQLVHILYLNFSFFHYFSKRKVKRLLALKPWCGSNDSSVVSVGKPTQWHITLALLNSKLAVKKKDAVKQPNHSEVETHMNE